MKKLCLALVCAIVCSTVAFAQQGKSAIGINLGYGIGLDEPKPKNIELGVKYQYNITDPIRIEAAFNYGLADKIDGVDVSSMDYGVNFHYLFGSENFKFYPLIGLGGVTAKAEISEDGFSISTTETKFMFNVGAGAEYYINEHVGINLELKYSYAKDFCRFPIMLGASYKF